MIKTVGTLAERGSGAGGRTDAQHEVSGGSGGGAVAMTSSIGLPAAFSNVVGLPVLAGAVAGRRLSQLARLMIATSVFVCAWLTTAALAAMRAPEWTMFMGGAVIVASIVVVIAMLHLWTRGGAGETQEERRGDEGGGGPRRHWPDAPQPGGGGSDPSWWPEFERRLALYAAERERGRPWLNQLRQEVHTDGAASPFGGRSLHG